MADLGKKIRKLIKDTGAKQIDVCRAVGLSPSRLSNYLSGSREPDFETLGKICDFLGVRMDDLRKDDNAPDPITEALDVLSRSTKSPVLIIKDNFSDRVIRIDIGRTDALTMLESMHRTNEATQQTA